MSMTCPVCAIGRVGEVAVGGFLWTYAPQTLESTAVLLVQSLFSWASVTSETAGTRQRGAANAQSREGGRRGACWCLTSQTLAEFCDFAPPGHWESVYTCLTLF